MIRIYRIAVVTLGLAVAVQMPEAIGQTKRDVRLVLQITVDGFRADLLNRYRDRFGPGGFRFLLDEGVVYTSAHYLHANTETIVGHTTLARARFHLNTA